MTDITQQVAENNIAAARDFPLNYRIWLEEENAKLRTPITELLEGAKAQHKAIDILLATLIQVKPGFLPTKSSVWPLMQQGFEAIKKAEGGKDA